VALGYGPDGGCPISDRETEETLSRANRPVLALGALDSALRMRQWQRRDLYEHEWHAGGNLCFDGEGNLRNRQPVAAAHADGSVVRIETSSVP
jgi:hypothetical protein